MPEFMPIVVPHANCGPLKARGAVTGTQYSIVPTGTWVWCEDLPALLSETRECCPLTDEPVRAFYLVAGSIEQVVRYRPWPGATVAEATGVAVGLAEGKEERAPAQGAGLDAATDEAKAADEPSQGRRKRKREHLTLQEVRTWEELTGPQQPQF